MKSRLFSLKMAHNFTCQQSAVQKVVSEIPGSRSYQCTLAKIYLTVSESAFRGLKPISRNYMIYKARLPNLATDIAWERIKKFSHTNPTCLSNANYGKKTFSLLRCICISHFKSFKIRGYEKNTLSQEFFGGITVLLLMLSLKIRIRTRKRKPLN